MAELDMMRHGERLANAIQFGEFRQLPLKDSQGLHYTKSAREASPQNAVETAIRHFADTAEQRTERKELTDAHRQQLERAEEQSIKARDYNSAIKKILGDHCRAAGVSPNQIRPDLNSQQIAEVREFAERQPFLSKTRSAFTDAARHAEELHREREAAEASRQAEQARSLDQATPSRHHSVSQQQARTDRFDRDTYSRGR